MSIKGVNSKYAAEFIETHDDAILIDVRTTEEWQRTGIPLKDHKKLVLLSWRLLPDMRINPDFEKEFSSIITNKNGILFFICKSGGRSSEAAAFASNLGYLNCYNIVDGFEGSLELQGWKNCELPWQVF